MPVPSTCQTPSPATVKVFPALVKVPPVAPTVNFTVVATTVSPVVSLDVTSIAELADPGVYVAVSLLATGKGSAVNVILAGTEVLLCASSTV